MRGREGLVAVVQAPSQEVAESNGLIHLHACCAMEKLSSSDSLVCQCTFVVTVVRVGLVGDSKELGIPTLLSIFMIGAVPFCNALIKRFV